MALWARGERGRGLRILWKPRPLPPNSPGSGQGSCPLLVTSGAPMKGSPPQQSRPGTLLGELALGENGQQMGNWPPSSQRGPVWGCVTSVTSPLCAYFLLCTMTEFPGAFPLLYLIGKQLERRGRKLRSGEGAVEGGHVLGSSLHPHHSPGEAGPWPKVTQLGRQKAVLAFKPRGV